MANAVPLKSKKKTASTSKTKSKNKPKAKLVKQTKAEEQFNTTCSKKKLSAKFKRRNKSRINCSKRTYRRRNFGRYHKNN